MVTAGGRKICFVCAGQIIDRAVDDAKLNLDDTGNPNIDIQTTNQRVRTRTRVFLDAFGFKVS
jgi:hypothetical protein